MANRSGRKRSHLQTDTVSLKSGNNPSNSSALTTEVPLGTHSGIKESDMPLAPASRAGLKASKGADAGCRPKKKVLYLPFTPE